MHVIKTILAIYSLNLPGCIYKIEKFIIVQFLNASNIINKQFFYTYYTKSLHISSNVFCKTAGCQAKRISSYESIDSKDVIRYPRNSNSFLRKPSKSTRVKSLQTETTCLKQTSLSQIPKYRNRSSSLTTPRVIANDAKNVPQCKEVKCLNTALPVQQQLGRRINYPSKNNNCLQKIIPNYRSNIPNTVSSRVVQASNNSMNIKNNNFNKTRSNSSNNNKNQLSSKDEKANMILNELLSVSTNIYN